MQGGSGVRSLRFLIFSLLEVIEADLFGRYRFMCRREHPDDNVFFVSRPSTYIRTGVDSKNNQLSLIILFFSTNSLFSNKFKFEMETVT